MSETMGARGCSDSLRVALVYEHEWSESPEMLDTLIQRDAILKSLMDQGFEVQCVAATLDLLALRAELQELAPDLIFNLVEGLGGSDRMMAAATLLYESLSIPYTGCPTQSIVATNEKLQAKQRMLEVGLPTPPAWYVASGELIAVAADEDRANLVWPCRIITKASGEHASIGMDDDAVVWAESEADIRWLIERWEERLGKPCMAELFIEGREFNISVLNGKALPVAEILFEDWPQDKPKIVNFAAKWHEDSPEYAGTPRTFELTSVSPEIQEQLLRVSERCWEVFGLRGAARVDWRVDEQGRAWILEVNANPCLNPDGGFCAACQQSGLSFDQMIGSIVASSEPSARLRR